MRKVMFEKDHILVNSDYLGDLLSTLDAFLFSIYLHVLLSGSHKKGKKGVCNLSIPEIAEQTGIKRERVLECLKILRKHKYITIDKRLVTKKCFRRGYKLEIKPTLKEVVVDS